MPWSFRHVPRRTGPQAPPVFSSPIGTGPSTPGLTDQQLGVIAVTLALAFPVWLRRRVERVAYLDAVTVRQNTGVMLRWPKPMFFPEAARPRDGDVVYVPLDLLEKAPLISLDGMHPDGSPVPILPWSRSAELASAGITVFIWGLSQRYRERGLTPRSVRVVHSVVSSYPEVARALLRVLDDHADDLSGALSLETDHLAIRHELAANLRELLRELAESLLLLVPVTYQPGKECVYRFTYCRRLPWEGEQLASKLGLADAKAAFRKLPLSRSESYHFEIEVPGGVRLARARLYGQYAEVPDCVRSTREAQHGVPLTLDTDHPLVALVAEDGDSPVIDLHARRPTAGALEAPDPSEPPTRPPVLSLPVPGASTDEALRAADYCRATPVERTDRGYATLRFRPDPFGTLFPLTVVSVITAALLGAALPRLRELDGLTAATVLLALPVVILGALASPGEHSFATRLLKLPRIAALGVGLCSLVVAASLAGGFIDHKPAPSPNYVCKPKQLIRDLTRTEFHCGSQPAKAEQASVPTPLRVTVDVAAVVAGLLALVLALGWTSTWKRGTGRKRAP